jgi:hypothetical protein
MICFRILALLALTTSVSATAAEPVRKTLTLQPIQVNKDDGTGGSPVNLQLDLTREIFRKANVEIVVLPPRQVNDTSLFSIETKGEALAIINGEGNGKNEKSSVINVWSVNHIGVFNPPPNIPPYSLSTAGIAEANGIFLSPQARRDTPAHEIGHILLPTDSHAADPLNLMADGVYRTSATSLS